MDHPSDDGTCFEEEGKNVKDNSSNMLKWSFFLAVCAWLALALILWWI